MFTNALFGALRGALDLVFVYGATGTVLAGIAAWIYRAWKRREDVRLPHPQAAWDAHAKSLRLQMGHFLEEMGRRGWGGGLGGAGAPTRRSDSLAAVAGP